jgi:hypothetical protein
MKRWFLCYLTLFSCCGLLAQEQHVPTPSLTATIEDTFTRKLVDGNVITKQTTGRYYRDTVGRTRIERGHIVTINNPTDRTIVVIDTISGTAKRFRRPDQPPSSSVAQSMSETTKRKTYRDLGTQVIEGVVTRGAEFSVVIPPGAVGNLGPLTQTSEVWRSEELGIAVKTVSNDPLNGERVQMYKNIVKGADIDSSLFVVPDDIQEVDVVPDAIKGSHNFGN